MKGRITQWLLAFLLLLGLGLNVAQAVTFTQPRRVYDSSGRYQGRMDENGRMYDRSGRYLGRKSEDGRYYDRSGRYQGQTR